MLKCLALDLDGMLWGGVIGEDGTHRVRRTSEYLAVQQVALDLRAQGILLAVCSKNNGREAVEALLWPGMLLRPEHFVAQRINWNDKATNLRKIADELNIGLDAIAFADDSPIEREWVKSQLPEVTVIDLGDDPAQYAARIRAAFDAKPTTEEDTKRSGYYQQEKARRDAEAQAPSREQFLASLGLVLEVGRGSPETAARIAQLSQRTNQFTFNGQRYSEDDIRALLEGDRHRLYWARLKDRFGDYGIIAAAVVSAFGLDAFYLSCRAMGRDVEQAFLNAIDKDSDFSHAKVHDTGRNAPALDFFRHYEQRATPHIKTVLDWQRYDDATLGRILALAADTLGVPVTADASPENTPAWDSLRALNLMLAIERECGVIFEPEEMEIPLSLGGIAALVDRKKA